LGDVEHRIGDRVSDLAALERGSWDVLIDTSGFEPNSVERSAHLLAGRIGRYVFLSTIAVYADDRKVGLTETAAVRQSAHERDADSGASQGELKAACERVVEAAFPRRALIIRPGVMVGPYDPSERFRYWLERVGDGADVLVPDPPGSIQVVDARDVAGWILRAAEEGLAGVYNAAGPTRALLELLDVIQEVTQSKPRLRLVAEHDLLGAGLQPWSDIPLWLPGAEGEAIARIDSSKAIQAGLKYRPLSRTVRDTLEWHRSLQGEAPQQADRRYVPRALSRQRELELIQALCRPG
jgi:2'-hydroxyisoflavone reductase